MKAKTIILLLVIPLSGFCQIHSSIDFIAGVEYSYRNLNTSSKDVTVIRIMENQDNKESGKSNWRIGFNYNRKVANKIFLKTGIRLMSIGYKGEQKTGLRWGSEHNGMGEWIPDPNLAHEIQLIDDYWFFEIPMAGRFEFSEKKLRLFLETGVSPSIYLTTRRKSITDIGTNVEFQNNNTHNFNKFHLVGNLSFGISYSIDENLQIIGQPIFRYHLTKLEEVPIREYLFNYGVEIGIRRRIR